MCCVCVFIYFLLLAHTDDAFLHLLATPHQLQPTIKEGSLMYGLHIPFLKLYERLSTYKLYSVTYYSLI